MLSAKLSTMTELRIDDDVVRWAVDGRDAPADEALAALTSRPLLLLMHGFGSFEGDLIGLAPLLPTGFVCASPRAPLVAPPPIVNGYSWWPIEMGPDGMPRHEDPPAEFVGSTPHAAALAMLAWLDALDARVADGLGTGLGTVAPMGFSQGGCMVTSLLRLRPERFACGVNCSGFVAPGAFGDDAALAAVRPPMFWGRDEADPIISPARMAALAEWAGRHTALEAHAYPGIAHSISQDELGDIGRFLVAQVPEAGH